MTGLLEKQTLRALLKATPPLIKGAVDLAVQVQPNGIDLTLRDVAEYVGPGMVDFSNARRTLPAMGSLPFTKDELFLKLGAYLVTFNETVNIPKDVSALGRTRSTLLRCGAALHTAVWDAGYSGRSQSLMTVYNSHGITLCRNARIMQLVFFWLDQPSAEGYSGVYHGENL